MKATRLDPADPRGCTGRPQRAARRRSPGGDPARSGRLAGERLLGTGLGLPTVWVQQSYPSRSRQAPDEQLLADVAAHGVALMAPVLTDLGTGLPHGAARAFTDRAATQSTVTSCPLQRPCRSTTMGFEKDGIVVMRPTQPHEVISMKALKFVAAAIAASVALTAASPPAEAHRHGRGSVSLQFGWSGLWGPGYWGPGYWGGGPYYAYPAPVYGYPRVYGPPAVVSPPSEPVYIERDAPEESAPPAATVWWYWCPGAKGYYPYVQECPGGWQRVPPQPVPAQ